MRVREADRGDADAVAALARDSWHAAYGGFLSREAIDATVDEWYAPRTLRRHIDGDGAFLVVEADASEPNDVEGTDDDGRTDGDEGRDPDGGSDAGPSGTLLGFAHARYASGVENVVLRRIYVRPSAWDEGVGSALLGAVARRFADEHDRLSAVVFDENEIGLSFYERLGFETVGRRATTFDGEEHDERIVATDLADIVDLEAPEDDRQA